MTRVSNVPNSDLDLYADEVIRSPYDHYRELREAGPVVWLEQVQAFAVTRYAEARSATEDWQTFTSREGVSLTPFTNTTLVGTTLASDPPLHDHLRSVVAAKLTPRALRPMRPRIEELADKLVRDLVARGSFDAVRDLARVLPMSVVPAFVGWPEEVHDQLLPWAAAAFDTMGPPNARCEHAMAGRRSMFEYAVELTKSGDLVPDSLGDGVLAARDRGDITEEQCAALLLDYLAPALDTTISSVGNAVWLFGRYPDQWDLVRDDPTLIPNAYNEVLRLESPARAFSRVATSDTDIAGVTIPQGSRVLLLWASANRDERHFADPERFVVTRSNANSHLGFGYGVHGCAGQGLARLEGHAVLAALAKHVARFDVGEPVPVMNNVIRALDALPVTVHAS